MLLLLLLLSIESIMFLEDDPTYDPEHRGPSFPGLVFSS